MFKKVSRNQFIKDNDGKAVSLILVGILNEKQLNQVIEAWENGTHLPPKANKYMGIFHKFSSGFYREMKDKEKSYYYFERGSYVVSNGTISLIIKPLDEKYKVTGYRREN